MKRLLRYQLFIIIFFTLTLSITSTHGQSAIKRWIKGTVIATDTKAIPNTIVVSSITWKGEELIVGAQVYNDTDITIDGNNAKLTEIDEGDEVSLVYMREPLRLVAKRIEARRR